MKKHSGKWKPLFFITLFALYLLFFFHLQAGETAPPSEGWSRQSLITSLSDRSFSEMASKGNICTVEGRNDNFHTLYMDDGRLFLKTFDHKGMEAYSSSWEIAAGYADSIKASEKKDGLDVYVLDGHSLYEIKISSGGSLSSEMLISDEALALDHDGKALFYSTSSNKLFMREGNSTKVISKDCHIRNLRAKTSEKNEDIANLFYLRTSGDGKILLEGKSYDKSSGAVEEYFSKRLPTGKSYSFRSMDAIASGESFLVLFSQKDYITNTSIVQLHKYDSNTGSLISKEYLPLRGADPSPSITGYEDGVLHLVASVQSRKGMSSYSDNISLFSYGENGIEGEKILTKTSANSLQPFYIDLGEFQYLQWADLSGDTKTLYVSGSSPALVDKASSLLPFEWKRIFMDTLTGLPSILFMSVFPLLSTYAIVVVALALPSFFMLNRMERHSKDIVKYAIGLHLALKLIFTYNSISRNPAVLAQLPNFLKSPFGLYTLVLAGSMVAYRCMMIKYEGEPLHYWSSYSFFALVDISIFVMLVLPYYYSYMLLPYF